MVVVAGVCMAADRWTYAGATGPAKWGTLEKGYALCKQGTNQSPVDIPDADARKGDLPSLLFNYKPTPLKIIDDGHTIQVNYAPGSFIIVGDNQYELIELQFHKPGEHKITGKGYEMSKSVHATRTARCDRGGHARRGKGKRLDRKLWSNLPQEKERSASSAP
jgi:carbonic anhydrase